MELRKATTGDEGVPRERREGSRDAHTAAMEAMHGNSRGVSHLVAETAKRGRTGNF